MIALDKEAHVEEYQKILFEWNKTHSDFPYTKTLPQLFEEHIQNFSENIALIFQNQTLSYRELNSKANQIAHCLRAHGVKPNTIVALCMEPSFDLIIGILGILKAGGAYVPLDPHNPVERQRFILEDTKSQMVLTSSLLATQFAENNNVVCLDKQEHISQYPITNPSYVNQYDDLAYVIYTSGSTGKPKGVMITHRNVNNFLHWFSLALETSPDDIFDFSSSISFDFSVATTLFPMMKHAKIAICPSDVKKDPYLYFKHLQDTKANIIKMTPSHFRQFKEAVLGEKESLNLKYIIFGGETLYARDLQDWLMYFPTQTLFCEYGPTEATVATSWIKITKDNLHRFKNKIPIGKPALNSQLYILDKDLQPVPVGVTGELYIGGEGVAKGYLNRDEINKIKFIINPFGINPSGKLYKTGDLCFYLPDGNVEFVDRADYQVKIRGFRVELEEIEKQLLMHPDIREAVVIAQRNQDLAIEDNKLIAYCVAKQDATLNNHQLRLFLGEHLPDYMIPAIFMMIKTIPLSSNGKIDRAKLPAPELATHHAEIAPRTELEELLKNIWLDALNLTHISIDDNFFDVGGHSLAAARIITKIKKTIHKEITLREFYEFPTIGSQAKIIEDMKPVVNETITNTNSTKGPIPLSELQFLFWLLGLFYPKANVTNIVDRRRLKGKIDILRLNLALEKTFKNHPVFSYCIKRYSPIQYQKNMSSPGVLEESLKNLSSEQQEKELQSSFEMLEKHQWDNGSPLLKLKLFYLDEDVAEIQVALAHIISDEVSLGIFYSDLSQYYLNSATIFSSEKYSYKDYIYREKEKTDATMIRDITFWENHLHDAALVIFPKESIIRKSTDTFTSYFEIEEETQLGLQQFCNNHRVTISDSLCAAISLALAEYAESNNNIFTLSVVKSIRDNENYDHTIGLFVRSDLIKVSINNTSTLEEIAKQIQATILTTSSYQSCPGIVKLACLLKKGWKDKYVKNIFIKTLCNFFSLIFTTLNPLVLLMFGRVYLSKENKNYFINVNVMNSFISKNISKDLLGLHMLPVAPLKQEKMVDKNVINISFERDENNKINLIVSGGLTPEMRNKIGNKIMSLIKTST